MKRASSSSLAESTAPSKKSKISFAPWSDSAAEELKRLPLVKYNLLPDGNYELKAGVEMQVARNERNYRGHKHYGYTAQIVVELREVCKVRFSRFAVKSFIRF